MAWLASRLSFHYVTTWMLLCILREVSSQTFYGIAYSPYRRFGSCPSLDEIKQDQQIAVAHTHRIRMYSTECHQLNEIILELATTSNVEVLMGVWIDGNPARDRQEMDDLYKYLRMYPNAKYLGIAVGNEVLYRGTLSPEAMAQKVAEVKQVVRQIGGEVGSSVLMSVPVFSVDVIPHPVVVAVSDAVGVNIHPFYRTDISPNDNPEEMSKLALESSIMQINTFRGLYGGKEVFVTETGWPTSSAPHEHHRGNLQTSRMYLQKFAAWGNGMGLKYFWFELVDSPWKINNFPNEPNSMSEFNWGLYDYYRKWKQ